MSSRLSAAHGEIQRSANTKKGCKSNHYCPLKWTSRSDSYLKKRIPRRDRLGVKFVGWFGGYFGGGIGTPLKWPSKVRSIKVNIIITHMAKINLKLKKISPLQILTDFPVEMTNQEDNHSPSPCHLERSREIQRKRKLSLTSISP